MGRDRGWIRGASAGIGVGCGGPPPPARRGSPPPPPKQPKQPGGGGELRFARLGAPSGSPCVRDARPEGRDAAAPDRCRGIGRMVGAAVARRGWQRRYRCLPRAQPGLAPRRRTRPAPAVPETRRAAPIRGCRPPVRPPSTPSASLDRTDRDQAACSSFILQSRQYRACGSASRRANGIGFLHEWQMPNSSGLLYSRRSASSTRYR